MQFRMGLWAAVALVLFTTTVDALPVVSNVNAAQRTDGSGMVDIYYDLSGGVGAITVTLQVSNDGGATWTITPQTQYLSGNIGVVANGTGKQIIWDMGSDQPGVCWPDTRFKVIANDEGTLEELTIMLPGDVPLVLVYIPAGTFMMGRYPGEQDSNASEDPQHWVMLTQNFYMGKYEVTQAQWLSVMGSWPGEAPSSTYGVGNTYPAYYVSWNDAQNFVTALNTHITNTSQGPATVRLPSEAEWEYAARAGTTTRFYWGDDPSYTQIGDYAWYWGNAYDAGEQYAHVVGLKLPNAFGLYDMSGNVLEWCEDDWHDSYTGAPVNGSAWVDSPRGSSRVVRGGCWACDARDCRSAFRSGGSPDVRHLVIIGFRLAR